jgi:hypothetical protein
VGHPFPESGDIRPKKVRKTPFEGIHQIVERDALKHSRRNPNKYSDGLEIAQNHNKHKPDE